MTTADSFSNAVLNFYQNLNLNRRLPAGVSYMNPFLDKTAFDVTTRFYQTFYNDTNTRRVIIGMNPGRLGGGITGLPFTDPFNLELYCGIVNNFQKNPELS